MFSIESVLYNIYIYIHIYIYRTSWRRLSIAFHIGASLVRRLDTDMERFVDHILLAGFRTLAAVCELSADQLHGDHGFPKLLAGD